MPNVQVGDIVMVQGGSGRTLRSFQATVRKVARVWITVTVGTPESVGREIRFRIDDQTEGTQYSYDYRYYTMEQWAEKQEQAKARDFLIEQGLTVDMGSPWRERKIELANVLRAHLQAVT